MPLRLVFQNLFCPMGSGGQLGLYSEYFPEEETERVEGKKEEKKSDKQTREFGFKRHKKKNKKKQHSQIQRNGHRTGVNLTHVQLK